MTTQDIHNILDVLERKYKAQDYDGELYRSQREGRLDAIADVRHYIRECEDIEKNGIA